MVLSTPSDASSNVAPVVANGARSVQRDTEFMNPVYESSVVQDVNSPAVNSPSESVPDLVSADFDVSCFSALNVANDQNSDCCIIILDSGATASIFGSSD